MGNESLVDHPRAPGKGRSHREEEQVRCPFSLVRTKRPCGGTFIDEAQLREHLGKTPHILKQDAAQELGELSRRLRKRV